ncbi:MAG: aldo/keto reductase [Candidatus Helarchaeota archaeon]
MNKFTIKTNFKMNNGKEIPILGIGTFGMGNAKQTIEAICYALEIGYRHIDTASFYENEKEVGNAIKLSGIPRDELFITTKLWNTDHGYNNTIKSLNNSLKKLDLSYVDLFLIHWPSGGYLSETWKAMEYLLKQGKCLSIGVSNYMIKHLNDLLKESEIKPVINQIEFHPYLYQKELLNYCNEQNIIVEAYSPLTKGIKLNDEKLAEIASRYSKSPAQILLRWALQKEVIVIPKSSNKTRIKENANIFDFTISKEDMELLDSFNENLRISWYPSDY